MPSITSTNAILTLSVDGLFNTPVQIQGFSADSIYSTQDIESVQTLMGVDGILSGGFVYTAVVQIFNLQADSASNFFFQQWNTNQILAREPLIANGATTLKSTGVSYISTRGFLSTISPMPVAGKVLQPRQWTVTWNSVSPVAI